MSNFEQLRTKRQSTNKNGRKVIQSVKAKTRMSTKMNPQSESASSSQGETESQQQSKSSSQASSSESQSQSQSSSARPRPSSKKQRQSSRGRPTEAQVQSEMDAVERVHQDREAGDDDEQADLGSIEEELKAAQKDVDEMEELALTNTMGMSKDARVEPSRRTRPRAGAAEAPPMSAEDQAKHMRTHLRAARRRDIQNQKGKGGGKDVKIEKHDAFGVSSSDSDDLETGRITSVSAKGVRPTGRRQLQPWQINPNIPTAYYREPVPEDFEKSDIDATQDDDGGEPALFAADGEDADQDPSQAKDRRGKKAKRQPSGFQDDDEEYQGSDGTLEPKLQKRKTRKSKSKRKTRTGDEDEQYDGGASSESGGGTGYGKPNKRANRGRRGAGAVTKKEEATEVGTQIRCPCAYLYPRRLFRERELYPLTVVAKKAISKEAKAGDSLDERVYEEVEQIQMCSKKGCAEVAYFWCNRNHCEKAACRSKERFRIWEGCKQPVCWKHFKLEWYIDRDRGEERVIVNWHCVGEDRAGQGLVECGAQRKSKNCACLCFILSPFWVFALSAMVLNLVYFFLWSG